MAADAFSTSAGMNPQMMELLAATRAQTAAILASALIAASGRPHSPSEAVKLAHDFHFLMHPSPAGTPNYEAWRETFDAEKPHV